MQRLNQGIYNMTHDMTNYKDYLDYLEYINQLNYANSIKESLPEDEGWRNGEDYEEDEVNAPKHYMLMPGVEVRDVITALTRKIELSYVGFTGQEYGDYIQMMQYCMRFMDKGGVKDLEKARWYLDKLIESYDEN